MVRFKTQLLVLLMAIALLFLGGAANSLASLPSASARDSTGSAAASRLGADLCRAPSSVVISGADLAEALSAAGARVEWGTEADRPFFGVNGQYLKINGIEIQTFEYPTVAARQKDSDLISPNGYSIGNHFVLWADKPNFWAVGRLIVLYDGHDESLLGLLRRTLGDSLEPSSEAGIYAAVVRQVYAQNAASLAGSDVIYLLHEADSGKTVSQSVRSAVLCSLIGSPSQFIWLPEGESATQVEATLGGSPLIVFGDIRFQVGQLGLVAAALRSPASASRVYVVQQEGGDWTVDRTLTPWATQ